MDACLRCQAESKVDAKSLGAGASKDCVVSRNKKISHANVLAFPESDIILFRETIEIIDKFNGIFCRLFGENAIIHFTTVA